MDAPIGKGCVMAQSMRTTLVLMMQKLGRDYRIKNDPDILLKAAKHNLREITAELHPDSTNHINSKLSRHNQILRGKSTALGVVSDNNRLMFEANAKVKRVDNIRGIELVLSLPNRFPFDGNACFEDFVLWVESYFPSIPILSAVAHWDESTPHIHVILLPLIDGRLQGHVVMGNRSQINKMRESCFEAVGKKYGMDLTKRDKLDVAEATVIASDTINTIVTNPELLKDVRIKNVLVAAIAGNPYPLAGLVNATKHKKRSKPRKQTFVGIMTSAVKPDKQCYSRSKSLQSKTQR